MLHLNTKNFMSIYGNSPVLNLPVDRSIHSPYSKSNLFYIGILIGAMVVPKIRLTSDYTFGLDDFLSIGLFFHVIMYSINIRDRYFKNISKFFWIIIITGFLSHIFGNFVYLSSFHIPGEMIQYIKRFVFFVLAYKLTLRIEDRGETDKILKMMTYVYAFALVVGLLQMLGVSEFAHLYSRSEKQVRVALRAGSDFKMIGTAGMTTSWGVLCAYFYTFFVSMIMVYNKKRNYLHWLLMLVSILFALNTVSRSAYLSVLFVTLYLLMIYMFSRYQIDAGWKKPDGFMKFLRVVTVTPIFVMIVLILVGDAKIGDIFYRFQNVTPGIGTQHFEQNDRYIEVSSAIATLNENPMGYVMGLGRVFSSKHTEHIEVEPVYVLSVYGFLGLILRLIILYKIYALARQTFKTSRMKTPKLVSLIVTIATPMYFLASIGLAFWHEQVAGTPYWIAVGVMIALRKSNSTAEFGAFHASRVERY